MRAGTPRAEAPRARPGRASVPGGGPACRSHDRAGEASAPSRKRAAARTRARARRARGRRCGRRDLRRRPPRTPDGRLRTRRGAQADRKSTRLNSSHVAISYAVFCLKKKKKKHDRTYRKKKKHKQKTTHHRNKKK